MGTPLCMAPQLRHGATYARPASDVFSPGVMAHEVCTGQLPAEQPAIFRVFPDGKPWFVPLTVKCPGRSASLAVLAGP